MLNQVIPHLSQTGSRAMENLREMIHENESLNRLADRVNSFITLCFRSQQQILQDLHRFS